MNYRRRQDSALGAVLSADAPTVHSSITDGKYLETWVRENEKVFPTIRPDVIEQGVWIVTSTYSTKKVSLQVWEDRESVVKSGFSAGEEDVAPTAERGELGHSDDALTYEAKIPQLFSCNLRVRH